MAEAEQSGWPRRQLAEPVLLGTATVLFGLLTRYHWQQVCDDAFIAFRYANNLGAGLGPVWNRGEAVEGFSSPLWLGILVLGKALGAELVVWAGVVGVLCSALCLLCVHRCTLALAQSRLAAAIACTAAALIYPLYFWAPAGLETSFFAALVTASAWSLVAQSNWAWALPAAFLGIARPEGPFLALALLGLACLARGRAAVRIGTACLALGPALAWLVFRRAYYGEWMPNTYYAKATGALLFRLTAGILYARWALLALIATWVAVWFAHIVNRKILAALAFVSLALGFVVAAGGDWMWHARMLAPLLPALVALAVASVARAPASRRPVLILALALAGSPFLPSGVVLTEAVTWKRLPETDYQEGTMARTAFDAAHFIAANYPADALVAVNHAGALPFRLPNPALDMTGLCDHQIAHRIVGALHQKFDPDYVLARKPRLVVLNTRVRPGEAGVWYHPGYWAGETALVERPDFRSLYHRVPTFWEWRWIFDKPSYVVLFERVASPTEPARP